MRKVMVTTEQRGIFFGQLKNYDEDQRVATLIHCQNCLYYDSEVKGFLGLTGAGPVGKSRVGPPAHNETLLNDVTSISDVSDEAAAVWESCPWH